MTPYARALITAWQPGDGPQAVQQQVTARMERQQLLDREDPPLLWMIIGEAVLRNPVGGPAVLREQLTRLLDRVAEHPKIIVQVVPLDAGAHPGLEGPLVLVARRGEPDVAYLEVHRRLAMFLMPQVLGQLLVQRGLQHRLGQLLQQPVRPGQGQALLPGPADQLLRRRCSGLGSGLISFVTSSSVAVTTAPLPPSRQAQRDRARNTVRSTGPATPTR